MTDRGSWRKRKEEEIGFGGGGMKSTQTTSSSTMGIKRGQQQNKPSLTHSSQSSSTPQSTSPKIPHSTTTNSPNNTSIRTTRRGNSDDFGPAAPLQPLYISSTTGRPLPHPALYSGSDNWAFTPNDNLPSLPATPSRAMHALGWQRSSTPAGAGAGGDGINHNQQQVTPQSRDKSNNLTARAVLNKRMEDQRNYSPSPVRNQRPSPKVGLLSLGSPSSTTNSRINNFGSSSMDVPQGSTTNSITAVLNAAAATNNPSMDSPTPGINAPPPPLHHRDSLQSIASSTNNSLGQHPLSHSRRPSQVFNASPALSNVTVASGFRPAPPYRVYRPPHLRTDSYFGLQPKVAHYDRVSAPMLRGQSRSPSVSRSRAESVSISRTPSESEFSSTSPRIGNRRLSNLSLQQTSLQNQNLSNQQNHSLDSNSLIAKLANAKLDLGGGGRTRGNSPFLNDSQSSSQAQEVLEDVDFTVEDMMMSGSLTDQYYHSRTASISSNQAPFVDIFEIGDRLGPKMMHDGHEITIAETSDGFNDQSADWTGTQLEIVSKLGEGSYAVVYLVKEVPRLEGSHRKQISVTPVTASNFNREQSFEFEHDQSIADETILQSGDVFGTTIKASASGRLADEEQQGDSLPKIPTNSDGRYFALKCLCKRDLSEEMLEVQRLESTIHQSIPYHPNIVTLYRTYETPEWLFLVLEYCPGQDLFYWLEQAQDIENLGANTPGGNSDGSEADLTAIDATPPSPSLLASTESKYLLSRRRLRLISRMFQQICEAVGFCHERGISHRDLKPENFIVEDTRGGGGSGDETMGDENEEKNSTGGIKVKLTDFGLAVAQSRCIDFDCGSKPYMSYECRNNTLRWYNPIESDIWSLGIVLLNLIFHRNPFMEPNAERCQSFASYVQDPVRFLTTAFRGLKQESAQFLSERVFCDVTEGEENQRRHRISARELGEWASNLAEHLESPEDMKRKEILLSPSLDGLSAGADHGITSPLWHSRSPASSIVNSLMASPASNTRSINIYQELANMGISEEEIESFTPLFSDSISAREGENSKDMEKQIDSFSKDEGGEVELNSERDQNSKHPEYVEKADQVANGNSTDSTETKGKGHNESVEEEEEDAEESIDHEARDEKEGDVEDSSEMDNTSIFAPPSVTSTSANPKRRKRGARKGRTLAKQQLKRSRSAENIQSEVQTSSSQIGKKDGQNESARDRTIRELAEASQLLAREMSKTKGVGIASNENTPKDISNLGLPIPPFMHHTALSPLSIDMKDLQNRSPMPDSSNSDGATTTFSSLNSVSRGSTTSRSSSQFTNYGWSDSRKSGNTTYNPVVGYEQTNQSNQSLNNNYTQIGGLTHLSGSSAAHVNNGKPVLQDSGRTRTMQHPSSTAADWRERNTSNASLASISSINTINSFSSDIGSIRSTASAPPAMITQQYRRSGQTTSNSSISSGSRNLGLPGLRSGSSIGVGSGDRNSLGSRNMLAAGGRNLGTINERSSGVSQSSRSGQHDKDLDASYLAGIFGGRTPQQRTRNQYYDQKAIAVSSSGSGRPSGSQQSDINVVSEKNSAISNPVGSDQNTNSGIGMVENNNNRSQKGSTSTTSFDHSTTSRPSSTSEAESNRDSAHSTVPRKKMLGKFLQGVKNYNRGVKAAPAMPADENETSNVEGGGSTGPA